MRIDNDNGSKSTKMKVMHNVIVLDASSSMGIDRKYAKAVEGIRREIEELGKTDDVLYTQTVIELGTQLPGNRFSHGTRLPLESYRFSPKGANGMTPLWEVLGETIEEFVGAKLKDDIVLVKVFTDGQENSSKGKYQNNGKLLAKLIDEVKKNNNFTVTFVGTDEDVEFMIANMNLDRGDTLKHDNTGRGVEESFNFMTSSTISYSKDIKAGMSTNSLIGKFFKDINK